MSNRFIFPWVEVKNLASHVLALSLAEELVQFHGQFHDCFGRKEHRRLGLAYISGLPSNKEAKSVEPIALEFLDENAVRPLQWFMKSYRRGITRRWR